MSPIIPTATPSRTTDWSFGPDAAYEGSDPTGAVWVTVCGRGQLRGVALFGGWRDTIGTDLGSAVMYALADACGARRHELTAAATPPPAPWIITCAQSYHANVARPMGAAGTSAHGWVTVTVLPSGEVTDVTVAPTLLTASDFDVMREIRDAFRAAYAAVSEAQPLHT